MWKVSGWHPSGMCHPAPLQTPIHPLPPWRAPKLQKPEEASGVSLSSHTAAPAPRPQHTASRGTLPLLLLGGCCSKENKGLAVRAQPDPDILTAALCVSEARFLSREEKQASPLPQEGKQTALGRLQAVGSGKAPQGWAGQVGDRPGTQEPGHRDPCKDPQMQDWAEEEKQ